MSFAEQSHRHKQAAEQRTKAASNKNRPTAHQINGANRGGTQAQRAGQREGRGDIYKTNELNKKVKYKQKMRGKKQRRKKGGTEKDIARQKEGKRYRKKPN